MKRNLGWRGCGLKEETVAIENMLKTEQRERRGGFRTGFKKIKSVQVFNKSTLPGTPYSNPKNRIYLTFCWRC